MLLPIYKRTLYVGPRPFDCLNAIYKSLISVRPRVRLPLSLCLPLCVFVRSHIHASICLCIYSSIYSQRSSMFPRSIRLSVCFYNMDALYTKGTRSYSEQACARERLARALVPCLATPEMGATARD